MIYPTVRRGRSRSTHFVEVEKKNDKLRRNVKSSQKPPHSLEVGLSHLAISNWNRGPVACHNRTRSLRISSKGRTTFLSLVEQVRKRFRSSPFGKKRMSRTWGNSESKKKGDAREEMFAHPEKYE